MQGRPPTGSGMDMSNMQGLSMPPMPASPMAANPGMPPGVNPAMMMQPQMQRAYSNGSLPLAYGASPMPAAPGTPTSQQQQRLMQLQQLQQQQMMQSQFQPMASQQQQQQLGGSIPPPPGSPSSLQRPADLPSPSSSEMLQLQRMQQAPIQKSTSQRSKSGSSVSFQHQESSGGSVSFMPSFQRSISNTSSAGSSASRKDMVAQLNPEQIHQLLEQCSHVDKTIYVAKQLLGGSSRNGFLKATAAAQRIKKNRARQVAAALKKENPEAAKQKKRELPEQQQEEELKLETFNVRTAKKIKTELEGGLTFCANLHATIVSILAERDPGGNQPPLLEGAMPLTMPKRSTIPPARPSNNPSSPGDPNGSTLRKLRKRKSSSQQPSTIPKLSEYDETGKRKFSKKEHAHRVLEISRFRALREGDYVAARVSSRDLWILARVLKDYSAAEMKHVEFLKLSEAKRDSLFREKVSIKDVEEKGGSATSVARNLVLPLPRSYAEASEFGARCKKGSRVYAMYPMTTSLYSATVIDNSTYCRGEDDIVVVEFDGDESDPHTGALPQYHIPARFVTMIPREFPASQTTKKKRTSTLLPTKSGKSNKKSPKNSKQHKRLQSDDALNDMLSEMSHGAFAVDGDLGKFEQFEMGAFHGGVAQGLKGTQQAPMPPNPGLYRKS